MQGIPDTQRSGWGSLLVSVLAGAGALVILLRLGDHVVWTTSDPVGVVVFILHRLALALAGWVVLSGVVVGWTITGLIGSEMARSLALFAAPWLRRIVISGMAGGVAVTGLMTPMRAIADQAEPAPVTRVIDLPQPIRDVLAKEKPEHTQPPRKTSLRRIDSEEKGGSSQKPAKSLPESVRVRSGDNLWDIAASRVGVVTGDTPTETEIAEYWARVVAVNRESLLSGDPDLIYPGETVLLPPLGDPQA